MKRKILGWALLTAAVAGVLMLIPSCRLTVVGLLRGEHFCDGRPIGYWLYLLKHGQPGERSRRSMRWQRSARMQRRRSWICLSTRAPGTPPAPWERWGRPPAPPPFASWRTPSGTTNTDFEATLKGMGAPGAEALLPLLDDPDPAVRDGRSTTWGSSGRPPGGPQAGRDAANRGPGRPRPLRSSRRFAIRFPQSALRPCRR